MSSQTNQTADEWGITPILRYHPMHPARQRIRFTNSGLVMRALEDAAEMPADERPHVLMLCGTGFDQQLTRRHVRLAEASGWEVSGYHARLRSATFTRDGYNLAVRSSVVWFGAVDDTDLIRAAWQTLGRTLRGAFGEAGYVWPTPALTGQETMRSALPAHCEYPVLYPEILDILATMGQGRVEQYTTRDGLNAGRTDLSHAVLLDARWAYAHSLHNLPAGAVAHEMIPNGLLLQSAREDVGYAPSFWRYTARVPSDWRHVGLLPTRPSGGGRLVFPWRPGAEFEGWASGAEVFLAVQHGWRVTAWEKIHWPWAGRNDPAGNWIRRVVALRDAAEEQAACGNAVAALVSSALRACVNAAIGSWNRVRTEDEGFTPYDQAERIPAGAFILPAPDADGWEWRRSIPHVTEWSHPEWAATVYGRVRAHGAEMLLSLPVADLIAFRTDGVWLAQMPEPRPNDRGRPGDWRVKADYRPAGGLVVPRTEQQLLRLIRAATGASGGEGGELCARNC